MFVGWGSVAVFSQTQNPAAEALEQGEGAFKAGRYNDAIQALKKALASDPDYTEAKLYLGASYALQVVPNLKTPENVALAENAIETLKQIPEEDGGYHNALKLLALTYRNIGRLDDARNTELAALKISDDAKTHYTIGVIDWMQAYGFAAGALGLDGMKDDGAGNAHMSAETCDKIKEHNSPLVDDAITHLTRAIELSANYSDAMQYLNLVYRRRADFDCNDPAARAQDIELANRWAKQAALAKGAQSSGAEVTPP